MALSKNSPAPHQDRLQAVHINQLHPEWSLRQIARQTGRSFGFVRKWVNLHQQQGTVEDQPRPGRPQKLTAEATQHALTAAQHKQSRTAAAIASEVQQQTGLKVSISTLTRSLRQQGLKHLRPKVVPLMTAKQKAARLSFAKKALRRETVAWRRVMITDSSIFRVHAMGKPAGRWCTAATRGTAGRPKHSLGVHVYMGMTYQGVTTLKFVTGTHKLPRKYINPKTKQPQAGVGSKEYTDVLQQHFFPEGKRLFQHAGHWSNNWQLQQDNAPAHKTKENMQLIAASVPGGHFLDWPPNSPDLSPIENLWAWMEHQLGDREGIKDTADLQARLIEIRDSITTDQLRNYFDGMKARMERVVDLQGAHIGK